MRAHTVRRLTVMTGIVLFAMIAAAYAVTGSGSTTVQATVPTSIALGVPANLGLSVAIDTTMTTTLSIPVDSNVTWSMTVVKDTDLANGGVTIPSNQLVYTSAVRGGHGTGQLVDTQFQTTPTNVVTAGTIIGEAGDFVDVAYKLKCTDSNAPGTYHAVHTYVVTTP